MQPNVIACAVASIRAKGSISFTRQAGACRFKSTTDLGKEDTDFVKVKLAEDQCKIRCAADSGCKAIEVGRAQL